MAEKILMIALSPTMETGTLVRWRKKEGDPVASGDVLCEVETDKATMDYESFAEGVLLKIVLPEGGQAKVGDLIAVVGKPGEDISSLLGMAGSGGAASAAGAGGKAQAGAAARAPASPPRPAGTAPARAAPAGPAAAAPSTTPSARTEQLTGKLKSSPLARRLATERSIDLASVRGSGPGGRIVMRDIEGLAAAPPASFAAGPRPAAQGAVVPMAALPTDKVVPVSNMRKLIARRLSESMYTSPHYYLTAAVAMDGLLSLRQQLNAGREKKISLNAFLIAFAARTLARHPRVNSTWNGDTILQHGTVDVGLAVALPEGLITPVVRDCAQKGILAVDSELSDLIEKAKANKLSPQEYSGATFTISNLGTFGIEEFTAIINPPGSAILAVGAVQKEPVVEGDDRIVVRQRMRVTLSCDHRLIDGAVGAAFLRDLADLIDNPVLALL